MKVVPSHIFPFCNCYLDIKRRKIMHKLRGHTEILNAKIILKEKKGILTFFILILMIHISSHFHNSASLDWVPDLFDALQHQQLLAAQTSDAFSAAHCSYMDHAYMDHTYLSIYTKICKSSASVESWWWWWRRRRRCWWWWWWWQSRRLSSPPCVFCLLSWRRTICVRWSVLEATLQ